jgi:hypothetical protein
MTDDDDFDDDDDDDDKKVKTAMKAKKVQSIIKKYQLIA